MKAVLVWQSLKPGTFEAPVAVLTMDRELHNATIALCHWLLTCHAAHRLGLVRDMRFAIPAPFPASFYTHTHTPKRRRITNAVRAQKDLTTRRLRMLLAQLESHLARATKLR